MYLLATFPLLSLILFGSPALLGAGLGYLYVRRKAKAPGRLPLETALGGIAVGFFIGVTVTLPCLCAVLFFFSSI